MRIMKRRRIHAVGKEHKMEMEEHAERSLGTHGDRVKRVSVRRWMKRGTYNVDGGYEN